MVLEGSSSPADDTIADSFSDDSNPPSRDQYKEININLNDNPQPLAFFGPLFGFNQRFAIRVIGAHIQNFTKQMKRTPSQDEADAITWHVCKEVRIASFGGPLGLAGGMYRAYATRAIWKYPFIQPSADFDPYVVRIFKAQILRGELAKAFHRVARTTLYSANGVVLGFLLFVPYASSVATVGFRQDPRLKEYTDSIVQSIRDQRKERDNAQGQRSSGRWPGHGSTSPPLPKPRRGLDTDDASPTGGKGLDAQYADYARSTAETTYGASDQSPPNGSFDGGKAPSGGRRIWDARPEPAPSRDFYEDYDEASPRAQYPPPSSQQSQPAGSAWARIRQNAGQNSPRPKPSGQSYRPDQQRRPSESESFSFSNSDEDKQLAKEEAQRDFDERVERERRGQDFDASSSKKW